MDLNQPVPCNVQQHAISASSTRAAAARAAAAAAAHLAQQQPRLCWAAGLGQRPNPLAIAPCWSG